MCNQLLEEMNRSTLKNKRGYIYATERSRDLKNKTMTSGIGFTMAPEQPSSVKFTNLTFLKEEPETSGGRELKDLIQDPKDMPDLTRKHNLAARGHIGHGRNLSSTITFKHQLLQLDKD
jgi:hypothetical protein